MSFVGFDIEGRQVTASDPITVAALIRARDERARPARLDRGRDPEPERRPLVVFQEPEDRRARFRWGLGPGPDAGPPGAA